MDMTPDRRRPGPNSGSFRLHWQAGLWLRGALIFILVRAAGHAPPRGTFAAATGFRPEKPGEPRADAYRRSAACDQRAGIWRRGAAAAGQAGHEIHRENYDADHAFPVTAWGRLALNRRQFAEPAAVAIGI